MSENLVKVNLDVEVYGYPFVGEVIVDTDTEFVDFQGIEVPRREIYYRGYYIGLLENILKATAISEAGLYETVSCCEETGLWGFNEDMVRVEDRDIYVFEGLCTEWNGEYYLSDDCRSETVRRDYGPEEVFAPDWYWSNDMFYCDSCNCYIAEDDYYGDGECVYCHEDNDSIIEDYCASHDNEPIFFGEYKGEFVGLGFELEVDCNYSTSRKNNEVARELASRSGLSDDEIRFAHDGSLDNGFEIISQPHTVKKFWECQNEWKKMLEILDEEGYKSHNTTTCGLHVHVSRTMFGKTESEQVSAIAKVFQFFEQNWEELVKVSRRKGFRYCEKNAHDDFSDTSNYQKWRCYAKSKQGGHYVALNNRNEDTFEYRLGRGTLNSWSFFSWIDLMLTITKNAKRITVNKVETNDLMSWLGGIKESTAKYIYKRGVWQDTILALFPSIEWETDLVETN